VVSVKVKIGESVSTGKPIVILAKPGAPVIHADLSDVDPTRVATGQPARVELDTGKGQPQTFDATVSDVTAVGADSSAGPSATFQVTWADGQTPKFGSVVVVTLDLQRKDGVLVVPSNAIRHSGGRTVVEVQDGNLRRLVPIQVGITGLDRVEVVGGLNEGQMVLVGPS
jgi:HlyD family secretion protein